MLEQDRCGWLLRVHRSSRRRKKAKGQMALHQTRRAVLLHRWNLARHQRVGEAFTMLTMEPGPGIVRYHDRQIVILDRSAWAGWLNPSIPASSLIAPLPAGALSVEQVG